MRFHSALATDADLEACCRSAVATLRSGLGRGSIDLAVVFASPRHGADIDRLPVLLHDLLDAKVLVGCTGAAVIADDRVADAPHTIAVLAGRLPGVELAATPLGNGDLPSPDAPPSSWQRLLPATVAQRRGLIVLCEPFHCDARALLAGLDYAWPDLPKVGGIASGSRHPEGHALFVGRTSHHRGAVVLSLAGDIDLEPIVSQGCRPIGRPGRITKADRNRLVTVDDAPARKFVESQLASLESIDLELAERSPLFLGIASDPFAAEEPKPGGFLVRNILGIDPESGTMLVGEHLAVGRRVQLHLRDATTSEEELNHLLAAKAPRAAEAALLFRCLGREGQDHSRFAAANGSVPLVGFHCNGEIGPVGDATHMHGYTAAFALLRRPQTGGP